MQIKIFLFFEITPTIAIFFIWKIMDAQTTNIQNNITSNSLHENQEDWRKNLFQQQVGDCTVEIVRQDNGRVQGFLTKNGQTQSVAIKGLPTYLPPKGITITSAALSQCSARVTDDTIEITTENLQTAQDNLFQDYEVGTLAIALRTSKPEWYIENDNSNLSALSNEMLQQLGERLTVMTDCWYALGHIEPALECNRKALFIYENSKEEQVVPFMKALQKRAMLCENSGKIKEAVTCIEKLLSMAKARYGQDDQRIALILNNLSRVTSNYGDHAQAIKHCKEALEIFTRLEGDHHKQQIEILSNIALNYVCLNKHEEAVECYKEATQLCPNNREEQVMLLHNFSPSLAHSNDKQQAIEFLTKALENFKSTYGDVHQNVAIVLTNLGNIYRAQDQKQEALTHIKEAVSIFAALYGEEDLIIAALLSPIGSISLELAQTPLEKCRALEFSKRALQIVEKSGDARYPELRASLLFNCGEAFAAIDEHTQAMEYYEKALKIHEGFPEENWQLEKGQILKALGFALLRQHTRVLDLRALDCLERALTIFKQHNDDGTAKALEDAIFLLNTDRSFGIPNAARAV